MTRREAGAWAGLAAWVAGGLAAVGYALVSEARRPGTAIRVDPPPVALKPEPPVKPIPEARRAEHAKSTDPILAGLGAGTIRAGDPVEPLIRRDAGYEVFRYGRYVFLRRRHDFGGTALFARDGRLARATTASCIYHDTFFDTFSPEEWEASQREHEQARHKQNGTVPAEPPVLIEGTAPPPRPATGLRANPP